MARALVVIDIQNDYFPGGRMELVGAEDASRRARTLLDVFRASGEPLFHVQHLFETADAPFFVPGTEGSEIHADVAPQPGERVIVKHHPNAFRDTPLHDELVRLDVDDVVLCGMMTSMCVDASARAAADLGLRTTIAGDACAAPDLRSGRRGDPGRNGAQGLLGGARLARRVSGASLEKTSAPATTRDQHNSAVTT
jgi:nicotinamidase-related amidase